MTHIRVKKDKKNNQREIFATFVYMEGLSERGRGELLLDLDDEFLS